MVKKAGKDSVNDRMVKWTALPAIFLWLAASGSVVAMGILQPDIVLANLEGFIALIAIIGGTAQPAFATILELWKAEQQTETELHPSVVESKEAALVAQQEHQRLLDIKQLEHDQRLQWERQRVELGIYGREEVHPDDLKITPPLTESDEDE